MSKKIVGILLALALVAVGSTAFAYGPGRGWGGAHHGGGYGYQARGGYGPGAMTANPEFYEKTADIRNELYQKQMELESILAADDIDNEKAQALMTEINKLRNDLSQKRLEAEIEFRKKYPNLRQGYGPGKGYGPGGGYGRGYGGGYCWR